MRRTSRCSTTCNAPRITSIPADLRRLRELRPLLDFVLHVRIEFTWSRHCRLKSIGNEPLARKIQLPGARGESAASPVEACMAQCKPGDRRCDGA